jgi:hypothetical protein
MIKQCKNCSKEFITYPSRLKRGGNSGNFCSVSCSLKGQKRHNKPHTLESRIKIGQNTPKYSGRIHWNWKGGISEINDLIRHSLQYYIWRNEVWKRDRWICRLCKKHCQRKNIIAHHLQSFADFPELRFSIDNGITLCRTCHVSIHRPGDNNKNEI